MVLINPVLFSHLVTACTLSVYGADDDFFHLTDLSSLLSIDPSSSFRVTCGRSSILAKEYLSRHGYRARILATHGFDLSDPNDLCHQTVECFDSDQSSFIHFCPTTNIVFTDFTQKPLNYPQTLLALRNNSVAFHRIRPFVASNSLKATHSRYADIYSNIDKLSTWFPSKLCFPLGLISTLLQPKDYPLARSLGIRYVADFNYFAYIHSNSLKAESQNLIPI